MPKRERIIEIELLRGFAFLAVALQHAIAHYSIVEGITLEDGVLMTLLLMLAKFAVPVFIFITGMVLFYNYTGPFNYVSFLKKRAKDILVPYILWSFVFFSISYGWQQGIIPQSIKWFQMLFTGKNSYHLWYVVMIFQFYLLFPLFRYVIYKMKSHLTVKVHMFIMICGGILFVWLTANIFNIGKVLSIFHIPVITAWFTQYADRNFLYFSLYFVLGAYAGLYLDLWKKWVRKGSVVYGGTFLFLFGYYVYIVVQSFQTSHGIKIVFNSVSLLRPLMVVFLVSTIFVCYNLASRMGDHRESKWNRMLLSIGKYSYGAYLVHALMLKYSYYFDVTWFVHWPVIFRMLISFVICVLFSYVLVWILSRLPFGKWTVGISNPIKRI
ncbi:surface polysaccharide O-acyltransferase-like enzyme [Paenibacillus sp. DS2015]|uniref:acyltransferase n=1 Tax=Paenibacillus sp. DS2015 TaxID=3373917 RepID=UPI003D2110CE